MPYKPSAKILFDFKAILSVSRQNKIELYCNGLSEGNTCWFLSFPMPNWFFFHFNIQLNFSEVHFFNSIIITCAKFPIEYKFKWQRAFLGSKNACELLTMKFEAQKSKKTQAFLKQLPMTKNRTARCLTLSNCWEFFSLSVNRDCRIFWCIINFLTGLNVWEVKRKETRGLNF